ncbi:MAG: glycosyltransferase family 9 protein, partial [Thermoguttaceae bacterium]|nr:glycosyltransferase family 9 protein [Thermoguttaceae bacterium]
KSSLRIGVLLKGGLGDFLISYNWVQYFREFIGDIPCDIDLFGETGRDSLTSLFSNLNIQGKNEILDPRDYDLFVSFFRLPQVRYFNVARLERLCPKIIPVVEKYREYEQYCGIIFDEPYYGTANSILLAMNEGKIRIQEPDIGGFLGIVPEYRAILSPDSDASKTLEKFGLSDKYITLNRSVDTKHPQSVAECCTKIWTQDGYNELIPLIKRAYPDYQLVQFGSSPERVEPMTGIDINLIGKTTLDDMKTLLRYSACHVDGEGGLVHLRHALRAGPSVVLFGPTPMNFYGYPENVNIKSDVCGWCEGSRKDWIVKCSRCECGPLCMKKLTVEKVMEGVRTALTQSLSGSS